MALGCGKLKTNHYTQQGGRVVHNVGFKEWNGPGREYMLMSEWVWGGGELWPFLLEEQGECCPWGGVSVVAQGE